MPETCLTLTLHFENSMLYDKHLIFACRLVVYQPVLVKTNKEVTLLVWFAFSGKMKLYTGFRTKPWTKLNTMLRRTGPPPGVVIGRTPCFPIYPKNSEKHSPAKIFVDSGLSEKLQYRSQSTKNISSNIKRYQERSPVPFQNLYNCQKRLISSICVPSATIADEIWRHLLQQALR